VKSILNNSAHIIQSIARSLSRYSFVTIASAAREAATEIGQGDRCVGASKWV
jgi:hypothetical protein